MLNPADYTGVPPTRQYELHGTNTYKSDRKYKIHFLDGEKNVNTCLIYFASNRYEHTISGNVSALIVTWKSIICPSPTLPPAPITHL